MIEEDFLILQARKEDINLPCAWIRIPSRENDVKKGPIKITYNGKPCYLQCRTVDDTLDNHKSYKIIKHGYPNKNIIFISEHYRDLLGIDKYKVTTSKNIYEESEYKKCKLRIKYPNGISKYIYFCRAACQHPDIYAKISIRLGMLSLVLGLVSLLLALCSIEFFSNLLSPQNSLPRNIYLVVLGGIAGHMLTLLVLEKVTKETWIVCIGLLAVVWGIILYISHYS